LVCSENVEKEFGELLEKHVQDAQAIHDFVSGSGKY
jgi:hypothetical protein